MQKTISYSEVRKNLKTHLDKVCDNHDPILIERKNGENVVILSENDYAALEETAYLLKSPQNTKRLLEAIKRAPKARIKFKSLKELKNEVGI